LELAVEAGLESVGFLALLAGFDFVPAAFVVFFVLVSAFAIYLPASDLAY
jgi:hypothetical protein